MKNIFLWILGALAVVVGINSYKKSKKKQAIEKMIATCKSNGHDSFEGSTYDQIAKLFENTSISDIETLTFIFSKKEANLTPAEINLFETIWFKATGKNVKS